MSLLRRKVPPWTLTVVALAATLAVGFFLGLGWRAKVEADFRQSSLLQPRKRPPTTHPTTGPTTRRLAAPLAQHVVIISIDGLRPDVLLLARMPSARSLVARGSYTFWARTVNPAYTLPSHTSMLTGVPPSVHGVIWNIPSPGDYTPVPTLFDLAKEAGHTTALAAGKEKLDALARPGSIDWRYVSPIDPGDDADVAAHAAAFLTQHRPDVLFVHLPAVDTAGHTFGWGSPQQIEAAEKADGCVAEVLSAARQAGTYDTTLFILTADHGGAEFTHGSGDVRSETIPWIAAGPGVRAGQDLTRYSFLTVHTEDTFATACAALGVPVPVKATGRFVEEILDSRELLRDVPAADQ